MSQTRREPSIHLRISLEHIGNSETLETFRVAFYAATERCLLPYPNVTGLTFTNAAGHEASKWRTRVIPSEPLDDFVLSPGARIAFDLHADIHGGCSEHRWALDLSAGKYHVRFVYHVDRDNEWHDFLAKRSRFAAFTPIWRGKVVSNTIEFTVNDGPTENAK